MKINKEMLIKLIVAAVVPGGFILWGAHEIIRLSNRTNNKRAAQNPNKTSDRKEDDPR